MYSYSIPRSIYGTCFMPTSKAGSSECFFCLSFFTQPISRIWPQLDTSQQFGRFKDNTATVTNYPQTALVNSNYKALLSIAISSFHLLEVRQEGGCESSRCSFSSHCVWKSINVCWWNGMCRTRCNDQRERVRGWDRLWEKELFLPSLHVKLELLLSSRLARSRFTHTNTHQII